MSEPTGGERHPFADIIDLFREVEANAQQAPASGPTEPTPAPARAAPAHAAPAHAAPAPVSQPPRGGTPVPRTPKTPTPPLSSRRRAVMLLPVALLALAGGATAAVIHHRATTPPASATPGSGASTQPSSDTSTNSEPTASTATASTATAGDAATAVYSRALDALAAAHGTSELTRAAAALSHPIAALRADGGALATAEAAHLDSLVALSRSDTGALSSFPGLIRAASRTAARVSKVAAGRSDVPDPSLATTTVSELAGSEAVGRLTDRVGQLANSAGRARLTAQLRAVAAQAATLTPTASSAARVVHGEGATKAAALTTALHALGSLEVIDGDHLASWTPLAGPLQQALSDAGVTSAAKDVAAIGTMISAAEQKLLAWSAATASPSSPSTSAAGSTQSTASKAADAADAAIASYQASASALLDRYATTLGALPLVAPGQQPSFELATRFHDNVTSFSSLASAVGRLRPPAGMSGAQRALVSLVSKGRAAALAGQAVAVSAEDCDATQHSCVLGSMKEWPAYKRAVGALGSAGSVRSTLASEARTAKSAADSVGTTKTPTTKPPKPPKPVV